MAHHLVARRCDESVIALLGAGGGRTACASWPGGKQMKDPESTSKTQSKGT